jgi:hypothetical protein
VMSMGRSSSLPLWKTAPARTRATSSGEIDLAPAGLGGLDQLVGHRQPGRARTRAFDDFGPQTYCGKGTFDG